MIEMADNDGCKDGGWMDKSISIRIHKLHKK